MNWFWKHSVSLNLLRKVNRNQKANEEIEQEGNQLLLSTMLTLIVVPSLYTVLDGYKEKRLAKKVQKRPDLYGKEGISG